MKNVILSTETHEYGTITKVLNTKTGGVTISYKDFDSDESVDLHYESLEQANGPKHILEVW